MLGYEQIELRGVSQCMNLKSPYLVSIFDIRHNDEGRNFVIMEYVAGPSLRDLLNEAPSGLGPQKTAFFLREIGKGLTYLHDRGIVHRDLKPGNIFYEDGYVKIGDYGLSKAISPSQHSGQTITVGTVHYMAPEIGQGRYDKSIDIYAMGVLVFEMLTGHVPFFGASHGESHEALGGGASTHGNEEALRRGNKKPGPKTPTPVHASAQEISRRSRGEHIAQSVSLSSPTLKHGGRAGSPQDGPRRRTGLVRRPAQALGSGGLRPRSPGDSQRRLYPVRPPHGHATENLRTAADDLAHRTRMYRPTASPAPGAAPLAGHASPRPPRRCNRTP